jgi:tetratricopeptide (TPR) repeat protein
VNSLKAVFWGFLPLLLLVFTPALKAQSPFAQGEDLFMQDKPAEALEYLEMAVLENPTHVQASLYLGIVYQQLDRPDDAIAAYRKILPFAGDETARIAYNLGNACFTKGDFVLARQYYTEAIEADPSFSSAYLNRANTLINTGELDEALADYETYLSLEGEAPQREELANLMTFIREEFAQAELLRITAENTAKPELDRRGKLILSVRESLRTTPEDIRALSTLFMEEEGE